MRKVLIHIATFILMIHTIIPHYHEDGQAVLGWNIESEKENFLHNLLSHFINVDLGDGHMEDYLEGEGLPSVTPLIATLSPLPAVSAPLFEIDINRDPLEVEFGPPHQFLPETWLNIKSLRAPPMI